MNANPLTIDERIAIARAPFSIRTVGSVAWGGAMKCPYTVDGRRPPYNPEHRREHDECRDYEED